MNAQRRTALTRLGLREPRQAHRDYRWRSRFLMLRDAPDSAAEDWMAAALAFVVIVCAAIFAGVKWWKRLLCAIQGHPHFVPLAPGWESAIECRCGKVLWPQ